MLLEHTRAGDILDPDQIEALQPRPYEGCFAHINDNRAINIFFIQEQIPEWLLAFLDNDLNISYLCIEGLSVLSLRFRHLFLTMPLYNLAPQNDLLTLCSLDYPQMRVNKIMRYRLPSGLLEQIKNDIEACNPNDAKSVYNRFDAMDESTINQLITDEGQRFVLQPLT
jgi:hypothetical protein